MEKFIITFVPVALLFIIFIFVIARASGGGNKPSITEEDYFRLTGEKLPDSPNGDVNYYSKPWEERAVSLDDLQNKSASPSPFFALFSQIFPLLLIAGGVIFFFVLIVELPKRLFDELYAENVTEIIMWVLMLISVLSLPNQGAPNIKKN